MDLKNGKALVIIMVVIGAILVVGALVLSAITGYDFINPLLAWFGV